MTSWIVRSSSAPIPYRSRRRQWLRHDAGLGAPAPSAFARAAAHDDDAVQSLCARALGGSGCGRLEVHIGKDYLPIGLTINHLRHPLYSE